VMGLDLAWHCGAALSHDNGEVSPSKAGGLYEAPQVKSVFGGVLPIGQLPLPRRRAFGCLHSWHAGPSLLGRAERSTPEARRVAP
jgi:hypothetical protein